MSAEDDLQVPEVTMRSKKRKKTGRMLEVNKKLRLQSHEMGLDCGCKRLKCFTTVASHERQQILKDFNQMDSWNAQSAYLAGLMAIAPVCQRRCRLAEEDSNLRSASFQYKVRVCRDQSASDIAVCLNAFMAIHGITKRRIVTIQNSLKMSGTAPTDGRGKHSSKHRKLSEATKESVFNHVKSFKGRRSHYSATESKRLYLPEELSIKKMHTMYMERYRERPVSYETYRTIFNNYFNISFGYPRSDTCSVCDEFTATVKILTGRLTEDVANQGSDRIKAELRQLTTANEVHKKKAEIFYSRKRAARKQSRTAADTEAICMDYQKNLPVPNISTSEVYFKRQLSFYSFNVHKLSDADSVFYTYTEEIGKKGTNEVCSFLYNYVTTHLSPEIKHLVIFCDSCGGQNKNFTSFRFLHYLVHIMKRFESIKVIFPMRGHSYMECDKNMGLINCKVRTELLEDWVQVFREARCKPSPFKIENVTQSDIRDWNGFLEPRYITKCPFLSRPIRELLVTTEHPRLISHRETYNGLWTQSVVTQPQRKQIKEDRLLPNEFLFPAKAYNEYLPISAEKYDNLQDLKRFCGANAQAYYETLPKQKKEKQRKKKKEQDKKKHTDKKKTQKTRDKKKK